MKNIIPIIIFLFINFTGLVQAANSDGTDSIVDIYCVKANSDGTDSKANSDGTDGYTCYPIIHNKK